MAQTPAKKDEKKAPAALDDDILSQLEDDGGDLGFAADDLVIPFCRILQQLSPQLNSRNSLYIRDAEQGDFCVTATQELIKGDEDHGMLVIPVSHTHSYTEWVPRETGGGLVKDYGADDSILQHTTRDSRNRETLANGNLIKFSHMYYAYICPIGAEDAQWTNVVLDFSSTQLKKARGWNTRMSGLSLKNKAGKRFTPPKFYMSWKFTTVPESNDQGDWMGFKIEKNAPVFDLPDGRELYEMARDFNELIKSNMVKAAPRDDDPDMASSHGPSDADGAPGRGEMDDDIPF